jgi:hypothetical protein
MTRAWLSVATLAWAAACGGGDGGGPPLERRMLILAADPMLRAADAHGAFRAEGGFEVEVVSMGELASADGLAAGIARRVQAFAARAEPGQESFVLLYGDAEQARPDDPLLVPAARGFGGEVSDVPHVDLDADRLPDLPVGRLPFTAEAEGLAYLERLRAHEAAYRPGPFNKTLAAFAGEGGFGPEIDGMLELAAGWVFDEMSYDFDMSMTYASANSAYHLPPAAWDAEYAARVQAGAVIQPYIGHTLDAVPCCLEPPARRGMLTFFSCSDGEYATGHVGCLAEEVLLRPHGPMASMGASNISHPYANAILPRELGHAILDLRAPTYGQAVLTAKRNMVERLDDLRRSLDALAEPYMDEPMPDCILRHVAMYNLLGDPAASTHLPPGRVRFDSQTGEPRPGGRLTVGGRVGTEEGRAPMASGQIVVTLEVSRTVVLGQLEPPGPATYAANHAKANDKVAARAQAEVREGRFEVELAIPADLPAGLVYLKAHAWNEQVDSVGNQRVEIRD